MPSGNDQLRTRKVSPSAVTTAELSAASLAPASGALVASCEGG